MPTGLILHNPAAGRLPAKFFVSRAASLLRKYGWQIDIIESHSGEHLAELARQAAERRLDAVFVAGGDGSIGWALSSLVGTGTSLGVLPVGTANVWARELGLPVLSILNPLSVDHWARTLATIPPSNVDVGMCSGRPFLMWAGIGLDAYLIHQLEPRARWVKYFTSLHYAAIAFKNANYWGGVNLHVTADGRHIDGHFLLAIVNNIRTYVGGLARLSETIYLDDGLMDLWLFSGDTLWDALIHFRDLLLGRHVHSDQAMCVHFRQLSIESETPVYLEMDGEPVPLEKSRVEIRVQPAGLKVLVPLKTPARLFLYQRTL